MGPRCFLIKWRYLHMTLKLSIFIWVFLYSANGVVLGLNSDLDKSALLEFKASVLDTSGLLSSWNSSTDHCTWTGIACDAKSRVAALNITGGNCGKISQFPLYGFGIRRACLDSNGRISGKLTSVIGKLSGLKVLSLPFNELSGELPFEIWGLENLEVLDLEGNKVSGIMPFKFKGLRNLRVLNLGFNEIEGEIPGSLSGCRMMQVLNLAGNKMNGSIPGFVGGFVDLRGLYLSFNQLSGSIPVQIGDKCGKLEYLELSGNFLTEGIPKSLANCRGLRSVQLFSNMLEGDIPSNLGQLNQLEVLDVSRNSLNGGIPPELGNCTNLSILVLSNSWDPLPVDISSMKLAFTNDEYNFYDGSIPTSIPSLANLRMLWAPRATLEGELPTYWGVCNNLEVVNLGQNYLTGGITERFSDCTRLKFLNLSSNNLTGELVNTLPVPCMTVFDISGNNLSGWIPEFSSNSCAHISPFKVPESYDLSSTYIYYFARRTQALVPLPSFEVGDTHAVFHNFGDNRFTSPLPVMPIASGQKTVYSFLAGRNKLNVPFPENLFDKCNDVSSMLIDVSYNGLTGPLPPDIASRCQSLAYLDASSNHITGSIPSNFGGVNSPVVINLSLNQLQGPIPGNLAMHPNLRSLVLAGNNLTGTIPTSLGQLHSLEVLDLSSNSISGEIPRELANLKKLIVLLLNNNKLTGPIPSDLANVTTITTFNVSFNNLSGPLPQNANMMNCAGLLGNPFLRSCNVYTLSSPGSDQHGRIGDTESYAASPSTSPRKGSSNGFNSIEIASIASAAAIVSVLIALICLFIYTRKLYPKSRVSGSIRKEVIVFTDIGVSLTFENVVSATGYFNASNCIGSGGFGATYKAEIASGVLVAIKRLSVGRFQGDQHNQFDAEIKTLGRLRHPNLVTLIGYHASETEMFLIYNYLPGGNLEKFIQDRSTRDWRILHKIALDVACALAYLHEQCVPRVLHRDVKPSNILLDEEHNAFLSDFGLARLLGTSETHATTNVAGTFGYVAPEYAMTCRVSDKADVYSYGVVLLELISDKKVLDPSFSSYGNGFNIVAWASMLLRQGRAKEFFTAGLWDAGPHDDLVEVLHLAIVCTVDSLSTRPTMKQVVRRLKQLQPPSC